LNDIAAAGLPPFIWLAVIFQKMTKNLSKSRKNFIQLTLLIVAKEAENENPTQFTIESDEIELVDLSLDGYSLGP
jgi:hypothetical protein